LNISAVSSSTSGSDIHKDIETVRNDDRDRLKTDGWGSLWRRGKTPSFFVFRNPYKINGRV